MPTNDLVLEKLLFAYNPGPGYRSYPSPARDSVPELTLAPYKHTPVPREYLRQAAFRKEMREGVIEVKELDEQPTDPDLTVAEQYNLPPDLKMFAQRVCEEDWTPQFAAGVNLSAQISKANGKPVQNSRVTVQYLRETHVVTLQAILDLESKWRKRKVVLNAVKAEIKAIEKLGKYAV